MDTHYPHHHSHLHQVGAQPMRPVCVYCLHLLGAAGVSLSAAMKRALEDDHECVEKVTARRPDVSLPFN